MVYFINDKQKVEMGDPKLVNSIHYQYFQTEKEAQEALIDRLKDKIAYLVEGMRQYRLNTLEIARNLTEMPEIGYSDVNYRMAIEIVEERRKKNV